MTPGRPIQTSIAENSHLGLADRLSQCRFKIAVGIPQTLQFLLLPDMFESAVDQDGGSIRIVFDNIQGMRRQEQSGAAPFIYTRF